MHTRLHADQRRRAGNPRVKGSQQPGVHAAEAHACAADARRVYVGAARQVVDQDAQVPQVVQQEGVLAAVAPCPTLAAP